MECNLLIQKDSQKFSITELRKMVENDPSVNLKEQIQGGQLKVQWPHTKPEPTGNVRAKLIHDRMHKKNPYAYTPHHSASAKLKNLSTIFTLIITIPAVAFSLNMFLKWLGCSEMTTKIGSVVGGIASFFVELLLLMIQLYKEDLQQKHIKQIPAYRKPHFN